MDKRIVNAVIRALTWGIKTDAKRATMYLSSNLIIRATRLQNEKSYRKNKDFNIGHQSITLTIGKPNYKEREYLKLIKKSKETFPVGPILYFPPVKNKKK